MENEHFFLGYRKLKRKTDIVSGRQSYVFNEAAKSLPDKLAFANVNINKIHDYQAGHFEDFTFSGRVIDSMRDLPPERRNVVIHIHGYIPDLLVLIGPDPLNTKILPKLVKAHNEQPRNPVGKGILLVWPALGKAKRKRADDRAYIAGHEFGRSQMKTIERLSSDLHTAGIKLHLMCHSYGHLLLNGLLAGYTGNAQLFDNVFLLASDIPHRCLEVNSGGPNGILVDNKYAIAGYEKIRYDLTKLSGLSDQVHVFYDRQDFLLYHSIKKSMKTKGYSTGSMDTRRQYVDQFITLGNMGDTSLHNPPDNFHFHNVEEIHSGKPCVSDKVKGIIEDLYTKFNYQELSDLQPILQVTKFVIGGCNFLNRHRYFFQSEQVVRKVQEFIRSN